LLVVHPLAADAAHAAERAPPDRTRLLAILFLARSTSSSFRSVFTFSSSFIAIVQRFVHAIGVGGERDVKTAAAVVRIEAEIGLFGDRVIDQRPIEPAAVAVADDVRQHAGGEPPIILRAGPGRHAHRVLAVELWVGQIDSAIV
jgi:hypothetical protein